MYNDNAKSNALDILNRNKPKTHEKIIQSTRTKHKCVNCGNEIPIGSQAKTITEELIVTWKETPIYKAKYHCYPSCENIRALRGIEKDKVINELDKVIDKYEIISKDP